jgi:hypothetical protein
MSARAKPRAAARLPGRGRVSATPRRQWRFDSDLTGSTDPSTAPRNTKPRGRARKPERGNQHG